jgi:hypothetical protein
LSFLTVHRLIDFFFQYFSIFFQYFFNIFRQTTYILVSQSVNATDMVGILMQQPVSGNVGAGERIALRKLVAGFASRLRVSFLFLLPYL